jgi:hypothetical protein
VKLHEIEAAWFQQLDGPRKQLDAHFDESYESLNEGWADETKDRVRRAWRYAVLNDDELLLEALGIEVGRLNPAVAELFEQHQEAR